MATVAEFGKTYRNAAGEEWTPRYVGDTIPQGYGGGGASGAGLTPEGLAAAFRQPDVTLPDSAGAKTALRGSQMGAVRGIDALIGQDRTAERSALRDALYGPAAADINYEADRAKQAGLETMFGKNMGVSSVTGDYVLEPVERARGANLSRASNDAFVRANDMANTNATTQAQILGQAFNQGTAGLTTEANVEAGNRNANQTAVQGGYTVGAQLGEQAANRAQQESQFGRSLGQAADLQREAFANTKDIASNANLAAGIGGGLSGLAQIFGPSLNRTLQGFGF